jgi:hypothetical protein
MAQPGQAPADQPGQAPADQPGPGVGPRVETCPGTGPDHARTAAQGLGRWLTWGPGLALSGCGGSCEP